MINTYMWHVLKKRVQWKSHLHIYRIYRSKQQLIVTLILWLNELLRNIFKVLIPQAIDDARLAPFIHLHFSHFESQANSSEKH